MNQTRVQRLGNALDRRNAVFATLNHGGIGARLVRRVVKDSAHNVFSTSLGEHHDHAQTTMLERVKELVSKQNQVRTHAGAFFKFICVHELERNPAFDIGTLMNEGFLQAILQAMAMHAPGTNAPHATIINRYYDMYLNPGNGAPARLDPPALHLHYYVNIRNYEATQMMVALSNNVKMNFGNKLRQVVNKVLDVKNRRRAITQDMRAQNTAALQRNEAPLFTDQQIADAIFHQVTEPARVFKDMIAVSPINRDDAWFEDHESPVVRDAFNVLRPVFDVYPQDWACFETEVAGDDLEEGAPEPAPQIVDSIYANVRVRNQEHLHFKAYYILGQQAAAVGLRLPNIFPMRRNWSPSYMLIDTTAAHHHLRLLHTGAAGVGPITPLRSKFNIWDPVVNFTAKSFQAQGPQRRIKFRGSLYTDGVGVSIVKQDRHTTAQGFQDLQGQRPEDVRNIATLDEEEHDALVGRLVFMDPGRRDVLFTMHEDSTPEDPLTYRYTANQLRKETKRRKYASLVARSKPQIVQQTETFLSQNSAKFNSVSSFNDHLNARAIASGPMRSFYEDLATTGGPNHHGHNPPFIRKLKFNRYMRRQQADARLVRTLLEQYTRVGENGQPILPAFVIGDWRAGNVRFHEPTPTKRLTRMLVKHGLEVFKIWEYNTSKICPICQDHINLLETFRSVENPRPHRRASNPTVTRWGLLRCTSRGVDCLNGLARTRPVNLNISTRFWNRDMAACLNFRNIVQSLRNGQGRPFVYTPAATTARRTFIQNGGQTNQQLQLQVDLQAFLHQQQQQQQQQQVDQTPHLDA